MRGCAIRMDQSPPQAWQNLWNPSQRSRGRQEPISALSLLETALQGIPPGLFKEQRTEILLELGHLHSALATGSSWQAAQERAILAYERALAHSELKSKKPFLWLQSKQRWALGLLRIAQASKDAHLISEAIKCLLEALKIFGIRKKHPSLFDGAYQHDLGSAFLARTELVS